MSFSEWKPYKLGDIAEVVGGGTPSTTKADYWGEEYPWLTPRDLSNYTQRFISRGERNITELGLKNSSAKLVPEGTVLLTSRAPIGYLAIASNEVCTNQGFKSFIVDEKKASNEFLFYLLKQNVEVLKQLGTGTTFAEISATTLRGLEFSFPDLKTQQRIASILSSLDDAIELNQKINKTLEEMAKAIFKEWFVDFNFPNATGKFQETEIGKIPVGWKVYSFGDLVDTISETYKFGKKEKIIFLNTGDILEGEFLHRNYSETSSLPGQAKKSIKKNDILFSEIRPANKRFAFVNFDADEYVVSTKLMVLRSKGINPLLVYFLLTREEMLKQLQHLAESRSGTFPQITFTQLKDLKVALPKDETLEKFIKYLEAYYSQSKQNIEENQFLINLRDTLLPKLMKGGNRNELNI